MRSVQGLPWIGLFEYDGLVCGAELFSEFLGRKDDTFSASRLETLANCPMRYLFGYVYGLKRLRDTGPEASPMDMGQYIHKILSLFFKELCEQGKNVSEMGITWSFSKAMEIARDFSSKNPFFKRFEFFESQEREFLAGWSMPVRNGDQKKRRASLRSFSVLRKARSVTGSQRR